MVVLFFGWWTFLCCVFGLDLSLSFGVFLEYSMSDSASSGSLVRASAANEPTSSRVDEAVTPSEVTHVK